MIRVVLPPPLRTLAKIDGELQLAIEGPTTPNTILDAIEERYPLLRGTIREHGTHKRRAFVRYFACSLDLSHESADKPVPDEVVKGIEPFMIVGAIAGG
jgi:hypothetical protein